MKIILIVLAIITCSNSFAQKQKKIKYTCNEDSIFVIVDKMPEFPGGEIALRKFIAEHIKYPDVPVEEANIGKIYIEFCVTKKGKIERTKVIRSVHPKLDLEAMRVIKKLPRWIPGEHKGRPVCVYYTIPVVIRWQ